ncbi:P-loop containing nucleoside triphosphate hydrolase [Sesbania bispinosa]|nr:P-loop containing nucleoside triphosphate hydrolase [Sesbania bispinosa]
MSDDSDDVSNISDASRSSDTDSNSSYDVDDNQDDYGDKDINIIHSGNTAHFIKAKELSIELLENDDGVSQSRDNSDATCGEFCVQPPPKELLDQGPTIIYVTTRKETLRIAKYLCKFGVKAAAYNAGLPKLHLRSVHKEFHENSIQVVVATVAFGMGIDKSNVRRIIHYGWPQSLEAYYQEAGRAGRDGKLADCFLYANLARKPRLLPNRRSEDLIKQAYVMLSDGFRCDVCIKGPPQRQNLKEEACILLQTIGVHNACSYSMDSLYNDDIHFDSKDIRQGERPSLKILVRNIREQFKKFLTTDILWWSGLARILEVKGYIREGDDKTHVQIKYPETAELGLEFLKSMSEQAFYVYPEADMLLARKTHKHKPYSSFSEWGKGWADPEIRRQRLERIQLNRNPMMLPSPRKKPKRKARKEQPDLRTSRGRLAAKLSKYK